VGPEAPADRLAALRAVGADIVVAPTPAAILAEVAGRGCLGVLLEGGPTLAGAFWAAGLVDEVAVAIAPRVLGPGRSPFAGPGPARMSAAVPLREVRVRRLGPDLWLSGMVR
jgi:diaminohydroxyphosphoribosylaminopyrimidine deaminase/5-amino-6-(5-phosphoribosylamino)uracil reductase